MGNKKIWISTIAIASLSQGFSFEKLIEIGKKINEFNLNFKDYIIIGLSFVILRLFYRGIVFIYKITLILEENLIEKFKNKVYNKKEGK